MAIVQDIVTNENGQTVEIYFEVEDKRASSDAGRETRGEKGHITHAQETFTKAMGLIRTCAEHVAKTVRDVPDQFRPHDFEVQFAISVNTEVGVVIAKSAIDAQIQVTLKWSKED